MFCGLLLERTSAHRTLAFFFFSHADLSGLGLRTFAAAFHQALAKNNGWLRLQVTPQASTLVSSEVNLLSDTKGTDRPSFKRAATLTVGSGQLMHCPPTPIPHPPPPWGHLGCGKLLQSSCFTMADLWFLLLLLLFFDKTWAAEQGLPVRLSPAPLPCESSHITLSHNQQTRIPNVALSCLPPCCQDLSNTFREPWEKWEPLGICIVFVFCFILRAGVGKCWCENVWILICHGPLQLIRHWFLEEAGVIFFPVAEEHLCSSFSIRNSKWSLKGNEEVGKKRKKKRNIFTVWWRENGKMWLDRQATKGGKRQER